MSLPLAIFALTYFFIAVQRVRWLHPNGPMPPSLPDLEASSDEPA